LKKHLLCVLAIFALVGSASASDISYQPVKKVFSWSGTVSAASDTMVAIPQFETRQIITQEYATCRPMSCTSELPGRFDAWQGLFNAPEDQRPVILSHVLLGMSPEVARMVLHAGFLRRMPPNWQALQFELTNAQNVLYSQGFAFNFLTGVFEQNGLANAIALNYADAAACANGPSYSCSVPVMKIETRQIGSIQRHCHFEVNGALLLPYEVESVALQVANPGVAPIVMSGDFDTRLTNNYSMSYNDGRGGDLSVALRFVNRPMRAIPTDVMVTENLTKVAGGLQLVVAIEPTKLQAILARGGKLEISHSLCRRDFFGGCAETVVPVSVADLSSGNFTVLYPKSALKSGKKYHAAVQLRASGTPYFSSELSEKEKSNKVSAD
jgi:hypothetical protein